MKLIEEKYRSLKPTIEYLTDEVVMAQAWKKTHNYIRSFNWYADNLALDVSALSIEGNAPLWARLLRDKEGLYSLELVPAAKSEAWTISDLGWKTNRNTTDKLPLRPLAHLTIRDQTWSTAAMLCLADAVESAQGNCSHDTGGSESALKRKVYSYGNRLVCDWKSNESAWFRWGNSEIYRKFFIDYQNFLKRPIENGKLIANDQITSDQVYIINLDLSKFYDCIDRELLIMRLKEISKEFKSDYCPDFWDRLLHLTSWQWDDESLKDAEKIGFPNISGGLPQGLVAAGFFANAYLIEFDRHVGRAIENCIDISKDVILHDYCRYVDDLRLVVSSEERNPQEIGDVINKWISQLLLDHAGQKLKLNEGKTKVVTLADLDNIGSLANRVEMIQSELSGPADREVLDNTSGILESLLTIKPEVPIRKTIEEDQELINVVRFDHDIRPDTLKRFAANRLESIVRSKRMLTYKTQEHIQSGYDENHNESELLAKKLIYAWMQDPSLCLVLRKAIEIYPSADLFSPVFKGIFSRSSFSEKLRTEDKITSAIMDYVLADLFRTASDLNGLFQVIDYPKQVNPFSIIELLSGYAHKVIASTKKPRFVERQALMLLAIINKPVFIDNHKDLLQHTLHSILINRKTEYQFQRSALFEVAGQITGHFDSFATLFYEHIEDLGDGEYHFALEVFAKRGGPFWLALWKKLKLKKDKYHILEKLKWAAPHTALTPRPRKQRLSRVIASKLNGFEHESALIKLAIGLIDAIGPYEEASFRPLSPSEISIKTDHLSNWDEIYRPEIEKIKCSLHPVKLHDPRFEPPSWLSEAYVSDNSPILVYWVGCILRASLLGGTDFTGHRWKDNSTITYKGVRTSWYKRRMAMMHSPESLVGEFSTISSWVSDLLMRCLQWPGFESTYISHADIRKVEDLDTLKSCLESRLKALNQIYCKASNLPLLPTIISRPKGEEDKFRIVTVQQLLPRASDFSKADPELNSLTTRAVHRSHVLEVSQLIVKTLETKNRANTLETKASSADLIVFPEVSVHVDDQDILKRLANKTKSIVFAGLVFVDYEGKLINLARWFIPDYRDSGRQWVIRDQGKKFVTSNESKLGVSAFRPCQHLIEVTGHPEGPFRISGAICYDATDINLAADLRGVSDLFIVVAHNKDVTTFDNMASALQYHMYQHVVITNIGEFGGSTIQAPYKESFDRLISHSHGKEQISISTADIDLAAFKRRSRDYKEIKTKPAGLI